MLRGYIELGPVPANEECQQLGDDYDPVQARRESQRYLELIRKTVGQEPEGAKLKIKSFHHDFGTYCEVVCEFDDERQESIDYAFKCEELAPGNWPDPDNTPTLKIRFADLPAS